MKTIDSFRGEYHFLSNFYEHPITYDGITYRSAEAAYQAQKTLDINERLRFSSIDAKTAKRRGKNLEHIRPDWDSVKLIVMYKIIKAKFGDEPLRSKLIGTDNAYLIEGNWWGDRFWGQHNGIGKNYLGKLLMLYRKKISTQLPEDLFTL